jgi:hypothetical protein
MVKLQLPPLSQLMTVPMISEFLITTLLAWIFNEPVIRLPTIFFPRVVTVTSPLIVFKAVRAGTPVHFGVGYFGNSHLLPDAVGDDPDDDDAAGATGVDPDDDAAGATGEDPDDEHADINI